MLKHLSRKLEEIHEILIKNNLLDDQKFKVSKIYKHDNLISFSISKEDRVWDFLCDSKFNMPLIAGLIDKVPCNDIFYEEEKDLLFYESTNATDERRRIYLTEDKLIELFTEKIFIK